jgi:tetratricopeptide (TPR) repeat protein
MASPAVHAAEDAAQLFAAGRLAFDKGDFPAALDGFEAAARAGLSGPAVHFNIGVAAFRAGQYARAEIAFAEVARAPSMAALAHYNLGLVALRRNDNDGARRWFARAEKETGDDRLRALAVSQLSVLPTRAERDWFGYASFGAGYDDNVALVSSAEVLGVSGVDDAFAEMQLAVGGPLAQPWQFDASLAYLDYADLDEFDQLGLQGGARYRVAWHDWTTDFIAQLGYETLDGTGFESRRMVGVQTSHDLSREWRVRAQYRFDDIDGMNEFRGVTGHRQEVSIRLARRAIPWDLAIEYRFETSSNEDRGLSAARHALAFDVSHRLSKNWKLLADATLRYSRYELDENGSEQLAEIAVAVARTLSSRWRLVLRYDFTHNDADRPGFSYQRSRIAAGVEALL